MEKLENFVSMLSWSPSFMKYLNQVYQGDRRRVTELHISVMCTNGRHLYIGNNAVANN